jgi:hypothetical protein
MVERNWQFGLAKFCAFVLILTAGLTALSNRVPNEGCSGIQLHIRAFARRQPTEISRRRTTSLEIRCVFILVGYSQADRRGHPIES